MTQQTRVGIGGWNFPPWRGTFYPPGLPHAGELEYASRQLTAIEVNSTFYRTQTPATFAHWRDTAPPGFVFALKAPRAATQRSDLSQAGPAIERFLGSGLLDLGEKLGPINWQLAPLRKLDLDAVRGFLDLLPLESGGVALRHAVEARHPSFDDPAFAAALRERGVARVMVDADGHTAPGVPEAGFVYARLKRNDATAAEGYDGAALDDWAGRLRRWSATRPCFAFFIAGDKVRAPDAARAMLRRLGG